MNKQQLIEENMNLVYFLIHKKYPTMVYDEDLIQCGMVGLCTAADTWDENKSQFSTYACACILYEIRKEFRRRSKHKETLSLDFQVKNEDSEADFIEVVAGSEDIDFVDCERFYQALQPKERQIVEYRKMGLTNKEIGEKFGVKENTISMRLRKLRFLWRDLNGD